MAKRISVDNIPDVTPKLRAKWTAALRSGKYRRATGQLREIDDDGNGTNKFCCLGVACEVLNFEYEPGYGVIPGRKFIPEELQDALAAANDGTSRKFIKDAFADAGYDTHPRLRKANEPLAANAVYHATFGSIADWLDKNVAVKGKKLGTNSAG